MIHKNDSLTIARILKVNHAGEYSAIRIYSAQLLMANLFDSDLKEFLRTTLEHEKEHCIKFKSYMPTRSARPCRMMFLWGCGGYLLGLMTALFGKNAVLVCTKAVESTVHRHLNDQIHFLTNKDEGLKALIEDIKIQELEHLSYAENNIKTTNIFYKALHKIICISTETVIWLSTWGDVNKMKKSIKSRHWETMLECP